jgi:hypothetical protein
MSVILYRNRRIKQLEEKVERLEKSLKLIKKQRKIDCKNFHDQNKNYSKQLDTIFDGLRAHVREYNRADDCWIKKHDRMQKEIDFIDRSVTLLENNVFQQQRDLNKLNL